MIKNIVCVQAEIASANYTRCNLDHLHHDQAFIAPNDLARALGKLRDDIFGMNHGDKGCAFIHFKSLFKQGATMMLLTDEEFNQLETWHENGEDFNVLLFAKDGTSIGLLKKDDISW